MERNGSRQPGGGERFVGAGRYRSSISRAYYAVYCTAASVLEGCVDFAYDGNNPAHDQLDPLILNMGKLSRSDRYDLSKTVRRLRAARVSSDYIPTDVIDKPTAMQAYRDVK